MRYSALVRKLNLSVVGVMVGGLLLVLTDLGHAQEQPSGEPARQVEGVVAEPEGAIKVDAPTPDKKIKDTLTKLLPNYPNIRQVDVRVEQGVVELEGWVEDAEARGRVSDFVRRVEGVKLVLNKMKLDADVLTAPQVVKGKYDEYVGFLSRNWLLLLVSLSLVIFAAFLARQVRKYSEVLFLPFIPNGLLRSVIGSLISPLVLFLGILVALSLLDLTQTVASMLGLAGVVGLALGFAFRDIAENFIASMLLGVRPPFLIGDLITIGAHTGTVKSLNTRATVLVTLDGNHIRIPNAMVFKEVVINRTASKRQRAEIIFTAPYNCSSDAVINAVIKTLRGRPFVSREILPLVLLDGFEPEKIRFKVRFWADVQQADLEVILSSVRIDTYQVLAELGVLPYSEAKVAAERGLQTKMAQEEQKTKGAIARLHERQTTRATAKALSERDVVSEEGVNLLDGNKGISDDGEKEGLAKAQ